ncbi:type II secretion system protein [Luteolibacter pohnpeiensis]|uniref:Type II secretion system protein n=1 Tax=Luteolibacter pohnpeiensis TaxID=454153 RepID=A0A934VWI9_9BACT|nr:type II secretion system protein [Luteolibacter pohnpeiensis]MBK1882863.1 type II secretion system protein [Luteolibacter pohnpeiensis]
MAKTQKNGFTLVELLVVIVIIAVLGTMSAIIGPKILKKGRQSGSVANMRQLNTILHSYAADHSNKLPAPVYMSDNDQEIYWHMILQQEISGDSLDKLMDDKWWKQNDSLLVNPLVTKSKITHKNVGYGMNAAIAQNIAKSRDEDLTLEDAVYTQVNLNTISDETQTPIIAPFWHWAYVITEDNVSNPKWEEISVTGKIPILFLDGHTDLMTPREYLSKHLDQKPQR